MGHFGGSYGKPANIEWFFFAFIAKRQRAVLYGAVLIELGHQSWWICQLLAISQLLPISRLSTPTTGCASITSGSDRE